MFDSGQWPAGAEPCAVVMTAVVDQQDVAELRSALERACADSEDDVYVHCGALNYACLDALRAFVAAAERLSASGRSLVLVALSAYFQEVFAVTGWDRLPGLVFTGTGTGATRGRPHSRYDEAGGSGVDPPAPSDRRMM